MITKDNLCDLLLDMGYGEVDTGVYEKKYPDFDCSITVVSYRITCNNGNQRTLINP